MRALSLAARVLVTVGILIGTAWGVLAMAYNLGWVLALVVEVWVAGMASGICWLWWRHTLVTRRRDHLAAAFFVATLVVFALWWSSLAPSDTRIWADDVALHLDSRVEGDSVTLFSVRNFNWRTQTDYDVRWETRTYDMAKLQSVDVICSYWMGPAIAHTLVSFGFADGQYVTFSIEIRKERGEQFSAIGGFFKQFETTLIAADERDILGVRVNVRGEDDYIYRVVMPVEAMRSLFFAYLDTARELREKPRWYNTATANCTTIVYAMAKHIDGKLPLDYRLLVSGYLPEYLYDQKFLVPDVDFKTLHRVGRFTDRAKAAGEAFSSVIRDGVPGTIKKNEAPTKIR